MKPISPFGYYGGKGKLLGFIAEHLPRGDNLLDLFGGSGVVSLSMVGVYPQIVYNDVNGRLCSFFRTLRECPEAVMDQVALTPASREDFEECWEISEDPIEDARRVFVRLNSSFMKKGLWSGPGGWQFHGMTPKRSTAGFLRRQIAQIPAVAAALQSLDIENRDWREMLRHPTRHSVIFADPPYDLDARSGGRGYESEMTEADHRDLERMLRESPAKSLVCGYRSDLYDDLYRDWERVEKPLNCNYQAVKGSNGAAKRVECLWLR